MKMLLSLAADFIWFAATPAQIIPEQISAEIRQIAAVVHRHVN